MKKIISVFVVSTIITMTVFSGCNIKIKTNNNKPTSDIEVTTSKAKETTVSTEETIAVENTYETIVTTEPSEFDEEALSLLYAEGYTENDLREKYSFDEENLNCENNRKYILDRMCNSVDFFTTLQASYTSTINNKTTWVTYAIDRRVDKAKEIIYNISKNENKCIPLRYFYVDGDYHVKLISNDNIKEKYTFDFDSTDNNMLKNISELLNKPFANEFEEDITAGVNSSASNTNPDAFDYIHYIDVQKRAGYIESQGIKIPIMIRRGDYNIGLVTSIDHYLPQGFALDALCNNTSWVINKLETNENNEIIHISGEYYDTNYDYERIFEICIEKNTGIPILIKEYNTSGKLVEELKTEQLIIDADIDENIFDTIDLNDIFDSKQQ